MGITHFFRGVAPPGSSSRLCPSLALSFLMNVANTQHTHVFLSSTTVPFTLTKDYFHFPRLPLHSKYRARNNHVSGFRYDTALHKLILRSRGFGGLLTPLIRLLMKACPRVPTSGSPPNHTPFCIAPLTFLFIRQGRVSTSRQKRPLRLKSLQILSVPGQLPVGTIATVSSPRPLYS
jgi:hypothetical protein